MNMLRFFFDRFSHSNWERESADCFTLNRTAVSTRFSTHFFLFLCGISLSIFLFSISLLMAQIHWRAYGFDTLYAHFYLYLSRSFYFSHGISLMRTLRLSHSPFEYYESNVKNVKCVSTACVVHTRKYQCNSRSIFVFLCFSTTHSRASQI